MNYIALLRGVNVGSKRIVKMDRLKAIFEEMGFREVRTYIQSGNVLFRAEEGEPAPLHSRVEAGLLSALGFEVKVILLPRKQLKGILAANPYAGLPSEGGGRVYLTFLRERTEPAAVARLRPREGSADEFIFAGSAVYVLCRGPYHRSPYSNAYFEKALGVAASTRGLETAAKLLELSGR